MTATRSRTIHRGRARGVAAVGLTAALAIGAAGCTSGGSSSSAPASTTTSSLALPAPGAGTTVAPAVAMVDGLTADEQTGLLYMIDEEKLAHDVYVTLGEVWDLRTFDNIASSETTHMAEVRAVLESYGIADPTAGLDVGQFGDPAFTTLYDQLVARGQESVTAALTVGAEIEELDIVDLDARAAQTVEPQIDTLYGNLRSGSENHLRAFTTALDARGVTYVPVHLDTTTYDAILAASSGRGRVG